MRIPIVFVLVCITVFCFGQIDHLVRYDFRCQSQIDSFSIKYPVCTSIGVVVVSDTVGDIVDVSPLKQIKKVRKVWIRKNPKLRKLELFNDVALDSIDNFYVSENDALDTLIVLKQTKVMVYGFEIYNDKPLYIEGLHHIDSIYQWQIELPQEGVSKIKGFDNLTKGGFLASLSGSIQIEGFNKFKKVNILSISKNNLLKDLTQFSSLEEVGSLSLSQIETKFNLNGLQNLKYLKSLSIGSIDTLENLKPIGQVRQLSRVTIHNSAVNLHLKELRHVNEINVLGLYKIIGTIDFDSVTFDSIKQLIFIENDGLKDCNFSMNYLPQSFNKLNLNYAGSPLYIYKEYNGNSLVLAKNPNLDICNSKAICDLIAAIPESNIAIEFNGENCSQLEAVEATCIVSSDEQSKEHILWYPNPVTTQLMLGKKASKVEVFDMTGRKIYSFSNTDNLNTSSWLNGLFLIREFDDENIFVKEQVILKN